jgi:uncharacterized membrane protein
VDQPVTDRRIDTRFAWAQAGITRATLRPGCAVRVLNVSAGGVLVQAGRPLRPGARVHVQLVTNCRVFPLVARVLRCAVWMLDSHDGATYRGALQFEERCDLLWEPETRAGSGVPATASRNSEQPGMRYPGGDESLTNRSHRRAI